MPFFALMVGLNKKITKTITVFGYNTIVLSNLKVPAHRLCLCTGKRKYPIQHLFNFSTWYPMEDWLTTNTWEKIRKISSLVSRDKLVDCAPHHDFVHKVVAFKERENFFRLRSTLSLRIYTREKVDVGKVL